MRVKCDCQPPHRLRVPRRRIQVEPMAELLRSNDPVLLSFATSLLAQNGIPHHIADAHMSLIEGSLGILARRLIVPDDEAARARRILAENGLAAELAPEQPPHV